jgi:hypothetical protein
MDGDFMRFDGTIVEHGSFEWFTLQESLGVSKNTAAEVEAIKHGDKPVNLNELQAQDKDSSETAETNDGAEDV